MVQGDSPFQNIWSPLKSVCSPGSYISNHVLKYAVPPDHSLRNISSRKLLISKYCTGIYNVPPLKRVPCTFLIIFLKYACTAPLYYIVLQGVFSEMYSLLGVTSVVLIPVKLQIIAFIAFLCTAFFLSLGKPAGYMPVTTYLMANSNNCSSFGFAPGELTIVNATQQTSTKPSLQSRHSSRALLATLK